MVEQQTRLQSNAFSFNLSHFDNSISPEERNIYDHMFGGVDGAIAYEQFKRQHEGEDIEPSQQRIERITDAFNLNVEQIFGVDKCEAPRFTAQMMDGATKAITQLIKETAPTLAHKLEPRNEVLLLKEGVEIDRIIELLSNEKNPRLRFETERHLILGYFWGLIQRRNEILKVSKVVADSHKSLEQNFYESGLLNFTLHSLHSLNPDNLNAVIEVNDEGPFSADFQTGSWKTHDFDVRMSKSGDLFYTRPRIKDATSALLKIVGKAANNGGEMNIGYVEDNGGIMLVHMGKFDDSGSWVEPQENDTDRALDEIIDAINNNRRVGSYVEDDEVVDPFDKRGQSAHHSFKRRKIFFENDTNEHMLPLEIVMYQSPEDYLNSRYHIGKQDPNTGQYDGAAHDLYMWKRNTKIMSKIFPGNVDLYDQELIQRAMQKQQQNIVGDLLSRNLHEYQNHELSM